MEGEIETYSRGSKRLDYAFGKQELAESIVRIGLTPYNFVISSHHRGLFIDFDMDAFLRGDPSHLMSPAIRGIKSNPRKQCQKYVEAMTKYLTEHKVFDRAAQAQQQTETYGLTPQIAQNWERIDRELLRACLNAATVSIFRLALIISFRKIPEHDNACS